MTTIEEIPKECQTCEHLKKAHGWHVCGCQCGKHFANGAHPLSPCVLWGDCEEDPDTGEPVTPECYEDEDAIINGHRCTAYISWLGIMHREVAHAHLCEDCSLSHESTPAEYRLYWDSGTCWLCEKHYKARLGVKE